MVLKMTTLLVGNYMTAYPISVKPAVPFKTVINFMAENGFATMIVMEEQSTMPLGVITEREILHYVVSEGKIPDKSVNDLFVQPFVSVTPDTTILEAAKLMIAKRSRILVFADQNKLVGIITASDMLRAFRKTIISPPLDKVISNKIQQCTYESSILDASKILHEKNIGSVIVSRGSMHGIFTQRDLVHVLEKEVDLTSKVGDHSSFPLVTAKKGILANEAASIMAAKNIKRLVLTENDTLAGIVTARDIVDAFQMELS
jgi:CBS domain-containing protein